MKATEKLTILHNIREKHKKLIAPKYARITWQERYTIVAEHKEKLGEFATINDVIAFEAKVAAIREIKAMGIDL